MSEDKSRGEILLEISNAISAFMRECFGKGPARAKAYELDNLVVVTLQGVMIDAEKTLHNANRDDDVRSFRFGFQDVTREALVDIVEHALGVRVVGHVSQILPTLDMVVELFVVDANTG